MVVRRVRELGYLSAAERKVLDELATGEVIDISEEGADAHIDMLAKKYLGLDSYPYRSPSETRVIYKIKPTASSAMG